MSDLNKYDYKDLTPFKWFVLENFPFIEADFDAITNYQLYCKVVEYLNEVINSTNELGTTVEQYTNNFIQLKNYVDNYFSNLDVQEEINNKLDALVEDGTITNLINKYVQPLINNQNENIQNFQTTVDETLDNFEILIRNVNSGSPIAVSSTSEMTDTTKNYINTTNGHWYYYNGTNWVDAGIYQSIGLSDKSITFNKLDNYLENKIGGDFIHYFNDFIFGAPNTQYNEQKQDYITNQSNRACNLQPIIAKKFDRIKFNNTIIPDVKYTIYILNENSNQPTGEFIASGWSNKNEVIIPYDAKIRICVRKSDDTSFSDFNLLNQAFTCESTIKGNLESNIKNIYSLLFDTTENIDTFIVGSPSPTYNQTYKDYIVKNATRATNLKPLVVKKGDILKFNDQNNYFDYFIYELDPETYQQIGNYLSSWTTNNEIVFNKDLTARIVVRNLTSPSSTIENLESLQNCFSIIYKSSYLDLLNINDIYYVSPNGNDNNDGFSKLTPLANIQTAINKGAKTIFCERGDYYNQTINKSTENESLSILPYPDYSSNRNLINLHNETKIELQDLIEENGIYSCNFAGNTRFNNVFINHTLEPITQSTRPSYNAGLWQITNNIENDTKLKPVLTLEELSEVGTFTWINGILYIHPLDNSFTHFNVVNDIERIVDVRNLSELIMEDVAVFNSYSSNFIVYNCTNTKLTNCHSFYNMLSDGFSLDNSNVYLANCKSYKSRNDGFNIHSNGFSSFTNCDGSFNYDDGISHHENTFGVIQGGKFNHNGKAGNAPCYGSQVNCYGIESCYNNFGLLVRGADENDVRNIISNSCLYKNNNVGISVAFNNVNSINDVLLNNTTETQVNNGELNRY